MASMVDILRDIVTTLGGTYSASDDTVSELLARIDAAYKAGGGGSSLPAVTSADNGDLLGVVEGAWGKVDPPAELPAVSSADNGSLLGVSDGAWAKVAAPTELPDVTTSDNGNTLRVVSGEWEKVGYPLYQVHVTVTENDGVYSASTDERFLAVITDIQQQETLLFAEVSGLIASRKCFIPVAGIDTAGAAIEFSSVLNFAGVGPAFVRINWLYNGDMSISVTPLTVQT